MRTMKRLKVLAIAAATGRVGYVFLIGGKLRDWGLSRMASKSPARAAAQTQTFVKVTTISLVTMLLLTR